MLGLDFVGFDLPVQPAVDRGEGHAQLFGQGLLGDPIFQTVGFELFDNVHMACYSILYFNEG